jgi:hypothetical protein
MSKDLITNSEIKAGWYRGLRRDIIEQTNISDPTVRAALYGGKCSVKKRKIVLQAALALVRQNEMECGYLGVKA